MLDSKTLIFTRGEFSQSIWKFEPGDFEDMRLSDAELDDLHDKLIAYYQYMLITNETSIKDFRANLVDLIWEFAYDEFESNNDWISLAKSTEEDLIWNVRSCFAYVIERNAEMYEDY
jgi:hypothetical protein